MIEDVYPVIEGKIHTFNTAVTTFYAPSDISGITGMCCEYIRAMSSWRNGPACYNCVLVNAKPDVNGAHRFKVAWVFLFFLFLHGSKEYPCAFIQWYYFVGTKPNEDIGCWVVKPDIGDDKSPHVAVIHIDCITCTIHLMPITRTTCFVDQSVTMHISLDTFKLFYLNRFANYHAFESLWSRDVHHSNPPPPAIPTWTWQSNTFLRVRLLYIAFQPLALWANLCSPCFRKLCMSHQDTSYLYHLSFYHPTHPSCLHFPHRWTRTVTKSVTREYLQGRYQHLPQRYSSTPALSTPFSIHWCHQCIHKTYEHKSDIYLNFLYHYRIPHPASCITHTPHHTHTTSTMNVLECHNPTIQADCILDHPTTLNTTLITLFSTLMGYLYKSRAIQTNINAVVKLGFAICTMFGIKVFLWRWVIVFCWIWWTCLV